MAGLLDRLESGALSTDFSLDSLELADDAQRQQTARDFKTPETAKNMRSPLLDVIERDAERQATMRPTERARDQSRIARESDRVIAATTPKQDTWAEVGAKALQNVDDRYGQAAGGLIAALPEVRNQLASMTPGAPLVTDVMNILAAHVAQPLDKLERETGKGISDRASAELERNAPEVGDSFAKRFTYDLFGSMVDLSAAVGVGVATRSPSASASVVATQVWGQQFAESVSKGRTEGEAFGDASFMAAAELIPESMALHEIMKPGQRFLGRVAKGALAEGIQETITQALQDGYSKGVLKEDMTWGQVLQNMGYAGLLGAAAGGPVAGGTHLAERAFGGVDKPGIVETFSEEAQVPTQEDIDSPIPTEIIQKGKAELAAVTAKNDINELLTAAGLPGVGERVTLTKPDGSQHIGTLTDIFQGDADAPGTGVKLAMDDGTNFSEYLDTLHDARYTLGRFKAPTQDELAADLAPPPSKPVDFILPAKGRITSPFGHRTAPKEGASTDHGGVDIAVPVGTPIGATAGGTVFATGSGGKRGNWIEIDHGNGLHSRYFHLESIDVEKGDPVNQGQVIGKSGATGNVTGAHLHWSVLKNGTPIDPMTAGLKGPDAGNTVQGTRETQDESPAPQNILDEPLITNRQEIPTATQTESSVSKIGGQIPTGVESTPALTFTDTPSGKGFVLAGATPEQIAEIKRELPKIDIVPNNRGEIVFSKKREATVREAIDRMTASTVMKESSQESVTPQTSSNGVVADSQLPSNGAQGQAALEEANSGSRVPLKDSLSRRFDAATVERMGESGVRYIQSFSYLPETQTLLNEDLGALDVKGEARMLSSMSAAAKNDEIGRIIVESIPVNVMNYLARREGESQDIRSNGSVLVDALSSDYALPVRAHAIRSIVEALALPVAVDTTKNSAGAANDLIATSVAGENNGQNKPPKMVSEDATLDEHPGLVIKSLQIGKEETIQPIGTRPAESMGDVKKRIIGAMMNKWPSHVEAVARRLGLDNPEQGDETFGAYVNRVADKAHAIDALVEAHDYASRTDKSPAEITRENLSKQPGALKKNDERDSRTMRDWSNTQIPNPDDRQRSDNDGGATKDAFLKDGKDYANAVASILSERGFVAPVIKAKSSKGSDKPGKAVRVNEAGPASSGDVILEMYRSDGSGVYMDIGTALAGPRGGISIMARYVQRGVSQSGPNQWLEDKRMSAKAMADKLEAIANQAPKRQPTNQEMLKAAQDSGRLEIIGIGGKTGEEGKVAVDRAAESARRAEDNHRKALEQIDSVNAEQEKPDFAGAVETDHLTNEQVDQVAAIFDKSEKLGKYEPTGDPHTPPKIAERGDRVSFRTPQNVTLEGKVVRVRKNDEGRTIYDIDVDGGWLQNAFADEAKIVPKPKPEVSANTVFTDDAAEKARAILEAWIDGNQLNSGIDPEVMQAGITLAGYHIEKGARTFAAYAKAMIDDLGDAVRPYLRSWYEGVRYHPAMEAAAREMSSAEDIGRALADLENSRGNQGSLRQGNEGSSPVNAERAEPVGSAASAPEREGEGGGANVRRADGAPAEAPERGSARARREAGSGAGSAGRPDRVSAEDATGRGRGNDTAADDAKRVTGQNWSIAPGSLDEARGAALKARDNVRAIEIVKQLDESGQPATREQQEALAKYVGWGGLKNAFNETDGEFPKGFEAIGPRIKELLTPEEYDTARRSIQYAHYTAEKVVRPMWDAAVRLGFKGGRVFEPGMGTGNFLGMMPPEIAANTQYAGLEFDYVTARIAQLLYPQSGIQHADFTKVPLAKNAYDLVIGNPPFSGTVIRSDPEYGKLGFVLHDFFFAKSIDAVRPGGLLMFVTSAGTMNKVGSDARAYLADRADLVGAVRLAGDAFKENAGTEVTTDIVVLRKRLPGEKPGDMSWVETVNKELPNRDGGKTTGSVSRYFEQHPDMVLGEEGFYDKLAAGERYAVRARPGQDTGKELQRALESLGAAQMVDWQTEQAAHDTDFASDEHKDGSYYVKDGKLYQQQGQVGVPVEGRGKGTKGGISAKDQERIRGLIPIRDALRDVFNHDLGGRAEKAAEARKALNREYDRFVQKYGPINKAEISVRRPTVIQQESARNAAREEVRLQGGFFDEGSFDPRELIANKAKLAEIAAARRDAKEAAEALGREWDEGTFEPDEMPDIVIVKRPNIDPFMDDQEGYRLRAIEHYHDESGEAKKSRIFVENVITKEKIPEINSPQDALLYVMNKRGAPDVDQIAALSKQSRGQVLEALGSHIFKIPNQGETYQTRELYLAGNVRKKLEIAKAAAERDSTFERNVEALEAVQPAPLGPSDISANLGMPWIPSNVIEEFGKELGLARLTVKYSPRLAQWRAEGDNNSSAARSEWGTEARGAIDLINAALNRTEVKVYTKVIDPQTGNKRDVIDAEATQGAQDKMAQIKEKFANWIWSDPTRADGLAAIYNHDYNNLVAPKYDGAYLTTPGISSEWRWRPHQTGVIARIIQSGNTYMAHAVGAGKTSAMIGAGMEMRRLGLVRKPMYVVPNHMLGQFTKEFYEQYPTAKIAVADDRAFHTDKRKQFMANVAANDLDAVIITHSSFGFIPMSDAFTSRMVKEKVDEFRDILRELKSEGGAGDRFTQRNIEKQIENLEQKLEGKGAGKKRDQVFTFEEMGVDFLFIDEAHLFRKLDFATKMNNVRGIDPNGSDMSFDLFAKTRHLEERQPGRSHVLASGTPVTNTMAELFSLSRYQQMQELKDRSIDQFDAWAGAFGDTVTALEQDPAGGYKPQTRFAKFVNVPELSAMVRQVMDVVSSKQLEQYVVRPKIKGGKRQMILAHAGPELEEFQERLKTRMDAIAKRKGPPRKGDDILLSVIGDGRKAAIDMRLINAGISRDEGSKLELMIDNVSRIAKETEKKGFHKPQGDGYAAEPYRHGPATQMIFSDLGINGDFPIHKYIQNQLIRRGLAKDQVAIISEYKSHVARQRLFNDMNEGKVRVLIGSVPKMGTGVNAQRQLYAIHNLDPQWYPANDEQRNGRGLRQGNQNPEIEIIDYSTKGTYDSQMWQLMETKARFIEGFFNGDPTMRSMEDLGEASQYEQAKAITTADPRIMEMTQYKQDLERALLRKGAHEREQFSLRSRIAAAHDSIRHQQEKLPNLAKDIEQRQDISGDNFKATVGSQEFDERAAWGEAVKARVDSLVEEEREGRDQKIGEIGGFKLTADIVRIGRDWATAVHVNFNGGRQETVSASTPAGIATSIGNMLRNLEGRIEKANDSIAQAEKQVADFTPQLGKQFTGQPEIDELRSKVDAIEAQLTAEAKAKEGQPQAPKESRADADRPVTQAEIDAVKAQLQVELKRLDPMGRVNLKVVESIAPKVAGRYWPQAARITVSVSASKSPRFTLGHEFVHHLRSMDFFTPSEWNALTSHVAGEKGAEIMKSVRERYPDLDHEAQIEEGVADLFGLRQHTMGNLGDGMMGRALSKMVDFVKALYNSLTGKSNAVRNVFLRMESGEIASRKPGLAGIGTIRDSIVGGTSAEPDPETVSEVLVPARTLVEKAGETFDEWRTWAQDRMLPLLRTQAAAEKVLGRPLEEHENPYLGEELMSGKVGAQLEHLSDKLVAPLFEAMKAEDISVDELESYLYARHAPERNAQIDKINPEMDGRGSGMSDIEAEAIMNRIDDQGRTAAFERTARYLDGIIKFAQETRVESELLSEDQLDAMREAYKHYVPLRGFEELDGADGERPKQGAGISVRGPESKRAFGRRSKADDILAYSIMQAEEAIIRGQKNMVAKKLYNLAREAKDGDFWKISPVTMRRKLNPLTGFVETVPDRTLSAEDAPFTVSLKVDGKEKRVTMNKRNPAAVRLAESMRRLDEQQVGKVIQFMGKVNRWLSAANTSFNPEFVITNAFRDIQTAGVNLAGVDVKGIELGTLKDYPKAMVGSMKGAFGNDTGEWGKWYREFVNEGGRVFFNQVQDLDTLKAKIEREFKHARDVNLTPQTAALKAYSGMKAIGEWIGNVNNGVENAIRLSAYKNGRERGMSPAQAASLAKNLTVNFNRRGAGGTTVNALYLFYNASMQGTARMLSAMKSRRVQKILIGTVAVSAALDALNMMISGRDDDDELYYDKISDFEKSRNLILMMPGGSNYLKIPLPYGYNVFAALGRSMSEIMRGRNAQNVMGNFASTVIDAFNPIGGANSILNVLAPTVADPVVDLVRNRDFADRPIMPDQAPFQPPKPDNQRYWGSVNPFWKAVTDTLNKISGGDDVVPGYVDMSPETLEYMFGVVFGAAGAFYDRTVGLGEKVLGIGSEGDDPIERNDIPLVRKLVGEKPRWYDKAAMYTRMAEVKQTLEYAKDYADKGDREGFRKFVGDNLDVVSMEGQLKQTRRAMAAIKKERSEAILAKDRGKIDAARLKEINTRLDSIQEKVIAEFNRVYIKTVKRPIGPE